ncbi:hypothetical protein [Pyxidicoccus trucidator]|uniref:hypothetical protein n=1 Tax=Pyxidicoccus trucidator TaxID=2709662 RepID=UPI0013DA677D|nr:hypothetical protein [Pyxidicoccus trucidator]
MLRARFVLPLLSVLALGGCGDDEPSCIDQASEFAFVPNPDPGGFSGCIATQTCNGGDVSVYSCFPPAGEHVGYALYVRVEDMKPIGFVTLEDSCLPDLLAGCE